MPRKAIEGHMAVPRLPWHVDCPRCAGTGTAGERRCPRCKGRGSVPDPNLKTNMGGPC